MQDQVELGLMRAGHQGRPVWRAVPRAPQPERAEQKNPPLLVAAAAAKPKNAWTGQRPARVPWDQSAWRFLDRRFPAAI